MATEKGLAGRLNSFLRTSSPVAHAIRRVRMGKWRSYLFGGVVRDILRPDPFSPGVRDVDVVIDDEDFDRFYFQLRPFVVKRNRFGGLRLVIANVPIDAWPLRQTWAFRQGLIVPRSFRCLTETPFLNIDSIVADISYFHAAVPVLHAERFIEAFTRKTLSIELAVNPFPWLAAIKATRAMFKYNLAISWPLAVYLRNVLDDAGETNFEREQARHYRRPFLQGESLWRFRRSLEEYLTTEEQTKRPYSAFEQWELSRLAKCECCFRDESRAPEHLSRSVTTQEPQAASVNLGEPPHINVCGFRGGDCMSSSISVNSPAEWSHRLKMQTSEVQGD